MSLYSSGNKSLIERDKTSLTAFYCSQKIPMPLFYSALRLFENLIKKDIIFIGGWQSPIEKRFLKWFGENYKHSNGLVWVIGKDIKYFHLCNYLKDAFDSDKLLILSLFNGIKRITQKEVVIRDKFIMDKTEQALFFYIFPGARLELLSKQWIAKNKTIFVFENSPIPEDIKNRIKTIGLNTNFSIIRRSQ